MNKAWKIALSIVAAVLLLFAIAEVGIRAFVADSIKLKQMIETMK